MSEFFDNNQEQDLTSGNPNPEQADLQDTAFPPFSYPSADEPKPEPTAFQQTQSADPYTFRQEPQNQQPYTPPYQAQQPQQQPSYTPYGYNAPNYKPKKKKSGGKTAVIIILVLAVAVAFAAIIASKVNITFHHGETNTSSLETSVPLTGESDQDPASAAVIDYAGDETGALTAVQIAEKCRSSVVGVLTYRAGKLAGEGSGVVMGMDKAKEYTYIITCAHVISGQNLTYSILTLEEKSYEAELVAYDTRTDIGVLKVKSNELTQAQFGDSDSLKIGETVYAIGNPGGSEYFGSITNGIISAIDRSVSSTYTMTCIQHNAAINPGNSGGALVNSKGQVIGINSSKIAATDYEGMGFAIPMSTVKPIVENLIKYGYVPNRPKLGIQYASVNSYQLYSMVVAIKGLPSGSLVIAGISSDSSLANTKAQTGDLIIAVNGKDMNDSSVLLDLIDKGAVGDTLTLTLCRVENRTYQTKTFDVTITLVEDKGDSTETTSSTVNGYDYGGSQSFEDFFRNYFGYNW